MRNSYQDKRGGGKSFGGGAGGGSYGRRPSFGAKPFGGGGGRSFGGGARSFGGGASGGAKPWERGPMHAALCSECGNECQVPFKPNGSKPVLCNFCFRKDGGPERKFADKPLDRSASYGEKRSFPAADGGANLRGIEEQLRIINEKLDKVLEAIEDDV